MLMTPTRYKTIRVVVALMWAVSLFLLVMLTWALVQALVGEESWMTVLLAALGTGGIIALTTFNTVRLRRLKRDNQ